MKTTSPILLAWLLTVTVQDSFNAVSGRQLFPRSNRNLYCIESVQTARAGKTE
jgi:hypothetical protein